ncbi:MAG: hypothetical protein AAF361_14565, partial [Bacteroidota bacterium]
IKQSGADPSLSFNEIRAQIVSHFDRTEQQKMRELLQKQKLGDEKPSTALRRLKNLAPGNESLVRFQFLEVLSQKL